MQIFVVDRDPIIAAKMLCDKHVIKQTCESAQLLSTCHRVLDGPKEGIYKSTHINHPANKWLRKSKENYLWLYNHFKGLSEEFEYRREKQHASWLKLNKLLENAPQNIPDQPLTEFVQCFDNKLDDPVDGYRLYYNTEKRYMAQWTKREIPDWFKNYE